MPIDHSGAIGRVGIRPEYSLFVGGRWLVDRSGAVLPTFDPSTGRELAKIADASPAEVDAAVASAREAFERHWGRARPASRKKALVRLAELVAEHEEELATIESLDVGMVRPLARSFSARALSRNLEYYASWCDKLYGEVVPLPGGDSAIDYTLREPFGVVGAIVAWNTPMVFLGSKLGPALATGNTVVVKPSELGSLSTLRFAELCAEAGIPEGVVNVVTGGPAVGAALASHPGVDKLTFTGGTATGKKIMAAAAANLKKLTLELGGKSPNLVFADADLDRALPAAATGALALTGQACAAGTRLLLEAKIHDEFFERLVELCRKLPVGDPLAAGTVLGPLISEAQLERVLQYVRSGLEEGAHLAMPAERLGGELAGGYFVSPAVFRDVRADMRIAREEIFGPVLSVFRFEDEEEAVRLANDTSYGLAAGVWTRDLARAHRVARQLRAGVVWVNSYGNLPYTAPFGGYQQSGMGREAGKEALLEYTQLKNVYVDLGGEL